VSIDTVFAGHRETRAERAPSRYQIQATPAARAAARRVSALDDALLQALEPFVRRPVRDGLSARWERQS
jgi:hypothetical protein